MAAAAAAGRGAGEPRAVPEARTREPRVGKRRARAAGRLSQWGLRFVACHADSCLFLSLRGLGFCLFLSVSQTGWLYYYC